MLVFLEDTSLLAEKVQQSKLAALGRLSASIAHEIRNPVGAMSHAGQLLGESPHLTAEDRRLTRDHPHQCRAGERHHQQRAAPVAARGGARLERLPLQPRGPRSSTRSSARPCNGRASGCTLERHELRGRSACRSRASCARSSGICARTRSSTPSGDAPTQCVEIRYGRMSPQRAPVPRGRRPRARRGRRARRADLRALLQRRPRHGPRAVPRARARADQRRHAPVRAARRAAAASSGWCSPTRGGGRLDE